MAVLVRNPDRLRTVVNHIVKHFQMKVEPNGFKAQVVTFDRQCCVLCKQVMDELIGAEASANGRPAIGVTRFSSTESPAQLHPHGIERIRKENTSC